MCTSITRLKLGPDYLTGSPKPLPDNMSAENPQGYVVEIEKTTGVYIWHRRYNNRLVTLDLLIKRFSQIDFNLNLAREIMFWPRDIQQINLTLSEPNTSIDNIAPSQVRVVPVTSKDAKYKYSQYDFEL